METPARPRWRARRQGWLASLTRRLAPLRGWRGWVFALLGAYALGAAVFLLAGGGRPAMTSLVAMEAEVESGETQGTRRTQAPQSPEAEAVAEAGAVSDAEAAAATEADPQTAAPPCSDIDPASHSIDPAMSGVHALGFVTLDEQPAAFAGYAGCPLIVNFFASWCVPCVTEMPDFERFWNAHGTAVAVLGLAANDRPEDAIETVEERGVTYPTGLDEGELFIDFGGLGMPTTVFISPGGEILETHSGLLTLDDITDRAQEHFGL